MEEHKLKAASAFAQQALEKEDAKKNLETVYITFDLQKTMPLPKLSINVAFYLRQLWLYNSGIHVCNNDGEKAYFMIWTEDEADRRWDKLAVQF